MRKSQMTVTQAESYDVLCDEVDEALEDFFSEQRVTTFHEDGLHIDNDGVTIKFDNGEKYRVTVEKIS